MAYIKINGHEFEILQFYSVLSDAEWNNRHAYFIKIRADYETVKNVFVDGAHWSTYGDGKTEEDRSDYCLAGKIIDYRDGAIGVYMGRKTEAERMEDKVAEDLPIIQKALPSLSDEDALKLTDYFPLWVPGIEVEAGERLRHNAWLWRVITGHTTQIGWEPDAAPSLFERVPDPSEEGTIDNPISYAVGMEIFEGKYYLEDDVEYLCFRDSGAPLYNALGELVGIYVEAITNG